MPSSFDEKVAALARLFGPLSTEQRYEKIIQLGQGAAKLDPAIKTPANRVEGCQSLLYLSTHREGDLLFFESEADALISAGLAVLLTSIYSGETIQTLLLNPPRFLSDIGVVASLSPTRANGLASLYRKMCDEALALFKE